MLRLRRLRRFLSLDNADRRLLLRAFLALGLVDLRLRVLGFRHVAEREQRPAPASAPTPGELERARRYARWLETASRHHVVRAHCLHQSLALHGWLRRQGLPGELRIGVRKEGEALRAHAWVELGGQVVNGPPDTAAAFTRLSDRVSRRG